MTTENEKKELSYDELMEKLRDPALLQAAASKLGLQVTAPKRSEEKKKELPSIEIPEDATPADIAKIFNQGMKDLFTHFQSETEERTNSVRQEVVQKEQAKLSNDIKTFAKSKKDFDELLPMIEPFWNTGKYTIQEAYELGRKASGKPAEKADTSKTEVIRDPISLSKTSEEDGTRSQLTTKPKSIKETAKESLENILSKSESLSDSLKDEDALQ